MVFIVNSIYLLYQTFVLYGILFVRLANEKYWCQFFRLRVEQINLEKENGCTVPNHP